ncbi:MAG: heme exporter protein CcmD [Alphaproteobacteria bacterium]
MSEFLNMGGYASYVWPAYGITLAVLGGLVIAVRAKLKKAEGEAEDT